MKIKKSLSFIVGLATILSLSTISVSAAGNIEDSAIYHGSEQNGGDPYMGKFRGKWDYTSMYVKNSSSSGGSIYAWVHRSNSDASGQSRYTTIDRYYGNFTMNGPKKNRALVNRGAYQYLINFVREDGYDYATLGYIMNIECKPYTIYWSPDSV